jgi:hypothetical protein
VSAATSGRVPGAQPGAGLPAIERLLAGLPGIVAAKAVGRGVLERVLAEESRYEKSAFLPLKNEGVREALARQAVVALIKDHNFRAPPGPTVYLVERLEGDALPAGDALAGGAPPGPTILETGGTRYRILGEEVMAARQPYTEKTLFLAESFVLFPERRASPRTPSFFLMPPLGFAELEERQGELGICRVISISPSSQSDVILREACGFPADTSFASLLVGFDWA